MGSRTILAIALSLGLLVHVTALRAQDYRARVQGTVTDQSKGAVAGAKVTLRSVATGVEFG